MVLHTGDQNLERNMKKHRANPPTGACGVVRSGRSVVSQEEPIPSPPALPWPWTSLLASLSFRERPLIIHNPLPSPTGTSDKRKSAYYYAHLSKHPPTLGLQRGPVPRSAAVRQENWTPQTRGCPIPSHDTVNPSKQAVGGAVEGNGCFCCTIAWGC